jgi:hypothetical protein
MGDRERVELPEAFYKAAWNRIFAAGVALAALTTRRRPAVLASQRPPDSEAAAQRLRVWLSQTPFDH